MGFPNTGYYLPIIYGILGIPVKKLGDMKPVLDRCRSLIPPLVKEKVCCRIWRRPWMRGWPPSLPRRSSRPSATWKTRISTSRGKIPRRTTLAGRGRRHHPAEEGDRVRGRHRPGFAAILGAAPTKEIAAKIAQELQEKNLYVFMAAEHEGKRFSEQLVEAGVQIGWPTRLVPSGRTTRPRSSPWGLPPAPPCPSAASRPGTSARS